MWLINVHTLTLEDFRNKPKPDYAILSHRWEDDEFSFEEMKLRTLETVSSSKKGFHKIEHACLETRECTALRYLWVDTCCINKESSAELSEAINSMYHWYGNAKICFAYLSDVSKHFSRKLTIQSIKDSLWWTRGWTLQELLAPSKIIFYDQKWQVVGTKEDLSELITQITRIDEQILNGDHALENRSIAQRMSWWGDRETTREEDVAYSLLGIFDVNIPMLYGEGGKAFIRLQEEIIRRSDDHTIFTWSMSTDDPSGLLAKHPRDFKGCGENESKPLQKGRSAYSITNRGLSIKLRAIPWVVDLYLVLLDCTGIGLFDKSTYALGIFLRRLGEDDQYARVRHNGLSVEYVDVCGGTMRLSERQNFKAVFSSRQIEVNVRQDAGFGCGYAEINGFRIVSPSRGGLRFRVTASNWNPRTRIATLSEGLVDERGEYGVVLVELMKSNRGIATVKLGFDFDSNPVCFLATLSGLDHANDGPGPRVVSDEGTVQRKSFWSRSPDDRYGWSSMVNGRAKEVGLHSGLWALKGDRINGLYAKFDKFETIEIWIARGFLENQYVWEVHLDGI